MGVEISSNPDTLVSCSGVSKKFCRNLKQSLWYGVKDACSEIMLGQSSRDLRKDEFWALDEISFELTRGECLGLLGRNGAGKTTLLKVLSGLIKPDRGAVTMYGKVGGLIALGAGFDGILSGRENICINGAILGYSRAEIEDKMGEIIDFAELHKFIDAPVQTYSSGMSVRLGFAIAVILTKPDILLLDEVLAVGDIGFTIKCINAVRKIMANSAVIFVSHNMQFISQFCTKILLMQSGKRLGYYDNVSEGIDDYLSVFSHSASNVVSKDVLLTKFKLCVGGETNNKAVEDFQKIRQHEEVHLHLSIEVKVELNCCFHVAIHDQVEQPVINYRSNKVFQLGRGRYDICIDLGSIDLNGGRYSFVIGLSDHKSKECLTRMEGVLPFVLQSDIVDWGTVIRPVNIQLNPTFN